VIKIRKPAADGLDEPGPGSGGGYCKWLVTLEMMVGIGIGGEVI